MGVLPGEDRLVKEVMSPTMTIEESSSVKDAAEIMRNSEVPALVVCRNQELIGVLTEHDVAVNAVTHARHPGGLTVQEVMTEREPIICREDAILADATRAMLDHYLQSVPVVNAAGQLVGILSMVDAAGAVTPHVAAEWLAKMRKSSTASPSPPLREPNPIADRQDQTKYR